MQVVFTEGGPTRAVPPNTAARTKCNDVTNANTNAATDDNKTKTNTPEYNNSGTETILFCSASIAQTVIGVEEPTNRRTYEPIHFGQLKYDRTMLIYKNCRSRTT